MLLQGMIPSPSPGSGGSLPHPILPAQSGQRMGFPERSKSPLKGGMMGERGHNPPARKSCQMP